MILDMQDPGVFYGRLVAHVDQVDLNPFKSLVDRSSWSFDLGRRIEHTIQAMFFDPMALLSIDTIELLVDGTI